MCFSKMIERFKKLPTPMLIAHIFAKFLGGVGIGFLLVHYLGNYDWKLAGLGLIIVAIIIALPGIPRILKE